MKKILIVVITSLGLIAGMSGATLGAAEAAKKPTKFKVLAEVSSHKIISGQTVIVTGTVKPSAIGRKVILQKRYKKQKGSWKKVDLARVLADGTFKMSDQPGTSRTRWYRVVKPAGDGHRKGVSKKMKVAIEPWDGRVEVKLFWETGADLNLSLLDSNFDEISAAAPGPTESGGEFDAASTTGCGGAGSFERVSWPADNAPVGSYYASVAVADPVLCDGVKAPAWRMEIRVNGRLVKTINRSGNNDYAFAFGDTGTW